MENRLYRDKSKGILGGVAAGIAEQMKLDITLIRALFILLVLFGKIGIAASFVVYCVLWICLPELKSLGASSSSTFDADYKVDPTAKVIAGPGKRSDSSTMVGFILVALGAIMLADRFIIIDWDILDRFWPVALVLAGFIIIFKARKT